MKYKLRPYQQEAVDAIMSHIKKSIASCVVVLPTGAGKSLVVAETARLLNEASGKRVLCLAPSKELVLQNREKYLLTGEPASLFSASAGAKNLRHPVVFGSPLTVKGSLNMFGSKYAAVVVDEAHGITPTMKLIIESMRRANPKLRVIALTATPYRMLTGYIYKDHYQSGATDEDTAVEPYYDRVVYELSAQRLIDEGFLTPPITEHGEESYDTSGLQLDKTGKFTNQSLEKTFVGLGRKTSAIVEDIVARSADKKGVMIFAATKKHADEIMESMPQGKFAFVHGEMHQAERARIINDFKNQRIKYIINIQVLTTGFDAPHVDHIALMRATESPGLFQQIIGRGFRLFDGKANCLISDYGGNLERHFSDSGNIFEPDMRIRKKKEKVTMSVICPLCSNDNEFAARPNPEQLGIDGEGYFIDLAGERIMTEVPPLKPGDEPTFKPLPAHFGRRCKGYIIAGEFGELIRCSHKWSFKECPECHEENDIAARYCVKCRAEIVDPNEKLKEMADKLDASPYSTKQREVTHMAIKMHYNSEGKHTIKVDFAVEDKPYFVSKFYNPTSEKAWIRKQWHEFCEGAWGEDKTIDEALEQRDSAEKPSIIMFRRDKGSKYHNVVGMYWGEV